MLKQIRTKQSQKQNQLEVDWSYQEIPALRCWQEISILMPFGERMAYGEHGIPAHLWINSPTTVLTVGKLIGLCEKEKGMGKETHTAKCQRHEVALD